MLQRILALAAALVVVFDVVLFDGRGISAVQQVALAVVRGF
jgi:deoxyinosine 3'endonuclease (endonuclease V)